MIKLLETIKFINENMIFFICNIFSAFMVLTNSFSKFFSIFTSKYTVEHIVTKRA